MIEVEVNENTPMVSYGYDEAEVLAFMRLCPNCGRLLKADGHISINGLEEISKSPNATCSVCGRVTMIFDGFREFCHWPGQ